MMSVSEPLRLAEAAGVLSLATDLAMGQPLEHGMRTAVLGVRTARAMDLPEHDLVAVFYTGVLHFAGCTADSDSDVRLLGDEIAVRPQMTAAQFGSRLGLVATAARAAHPGRAPAARAAAMARSAVGGMAEFRRWAASLPAQLPWWLAGPGMGLCVVALYGLANRRLGVSGAWLAAVVTPIEGWRGDRWRVEFLAALTGGALAAGLLGSATRLTGYPVLSRALPAGVLLPLLAGGGLALGYAGQPGQPCTAACCGCRTHLRGAVTSTAARSSVPGSPSPVPAPAERSPWSPLAAWAACSCWAALSPACGCAARPNARPGASVPRP
jgi:uncharacterized protein